MGFWDWIKRNLEEEEPAGGWPYRNFKREDVQCKCCGTLVENEGALGRLDKVLDLLPGIRINCGYRCPPHNAKVGGAPLSQHKLGTAFDLSTRGQHKSEDVMAAAKAAGFTGFGIYKTFVHVDMAKRTFRGK